MYVEKSVVRKDWIECAWIEANGFDLISRTATWSRHNRVITVVVLVMIMKACFAYEQLKLPVVPYG